MKTLNRLLATCIIMILSLTAVASSRTDSLMSRLKETIAMRQEFEHKKQARIGLMVKSLSTQPTDSARLAVVSMLYDEYLSFNTDSAFAYASKMERLAMKLGDNRLTADARLNIVSTLTLRAMYVQALGMFGQIRHDSMTAERLSHYYEVAGALYTALSEFSAYEQDRVRYREKASAYKDSVVATLQQGTAKYVINLADHHNQTKQYAQAISLLEQYLATSQGSTHDRAVMAYVLGYAYNAIGDTERYKQQLIISATLDMETAVREYVSLPQLALQLYKEGDINDAHAFMRLTMDDARKCNARQRILDAGDMFPQISESYIEAINHQRRTMTMLSIVIALTLVMLAAATYIIYKQLQKTAAAHRQTKESNNKLAELNTELSHLNEELERYNHRLVAVNREMEESSQIKEAYIAQFMNLCSTYIDKIDSYRKSLYKLLASRKMEELTARLKSTDYQEEELKNFYRIFDTTFLRLFPTFVVDFNKLLAADRQIVVKSADTLTTELRVFALIRLGITDSEKIAQFLHYSLTTIYNYRSRTRGKAAGDKAAFEEQVMQIGVHG